MKTDRIVRFSYATLKQFISAKTTFHEKVKFLDFDVTDYDKAELLPEDFRIIDIQKEQNNMVAVTIRSDSFKPNESKRIPRIDLLFDTE